MARWIGRQRLLYIIMYSIGWINATAVQAQSATFTHPSWHNAQQKWISQQCGDACHDVWFCRDYYFDELPDEADIEVSTAGWAEIFVNGRNIDRALLSPYKSDEGSEAVRIRYNVRRFLRQGNNTVAIDYAPRSTKCSGCRLCSISDFDQTMDSIGYADEVIDTVCHSPKSAEQLTGQLAVSLYGIYPDSTSFAFTSDSSWQCHVGRRRLTADGGEIIDSRLPEFRFGRLTSDGLSDWTAAIVTPNQPSMAIDSTENAGSGWMLKGTIDATFSGSSHGALTYNFSKKGFFGFARITLRDCHRGQMIKAGSLRYICNGNIDEQATAKFTPRIIQTISVMGSGDFSKSNVYMMEGVELRLLPSPPPKGRE